MTKTVSRFSLLFSKFSVLSLAFFALLLFSNSSVAQCGCDYTVPANQFEVDGNKLGIQPGDVICLPSGSVGNKHFKYINGTAEKPILIKNCGGQSKLVLPSSKSFGIKISYSSHFRITGSGDPGTEYGILIDGPSLGITIQDRSTDFEMDHFRINNTGYAGVFGKTDPSCNPATWRENFTMYNVSFHDNYVTNTGGESFYVGNSHYHKPITKTCDGKATSILEHSIVNAKVYNNRVENAGRDGIQVGAVISGGEIYNNYVYNYGIGDPNHINGIQINPGYSGVVYNNYVEKGAGYGLFSLGDGVTLFNNIAYNCTNGGIFCDDRNTTPGKSFKFYNNTLVKNGRYGIYMLSDQSQGNKFFNNIVVSDGTSGFRYVRLNSGSIDWEEGNNVYTANINDLNFVDVNNRDFKIELGSSAIDMGADLTSEGVKFDYDDIARPQGTKFDAGAHELEVGNPEADAGADQTIKLPVNTVNLSGSGSSDVSTIVGYSWSKASGGNVTFVNESTANVTLNDLEEGIYDIELEVTDANGLKGTDIAKITVLPAAANLAPDVNAGSDQTITLPTNTAAFTATASDSDGTVDTYLWEKVSGPAITLNGDGTKTLTVTNALEGAYVFKITVTDNQGATASDNVGLTVNPEAVNQAPTVSVEADKEVYLPITTVNISGTAADTDGTIVSLLWEKKTGPTATLVNATTNNLTVNDLQEGQYVFRLTATDDDGAIGSDEITVDVIDSNEPPKANAGPNQTITLPINTLNITGIGTDTDGTIASYNWVKSSGPAATIENGNTATATFKDLLEGTYVFSLTVTDDDGAIGKDQVQVVVNPMPINEAPVVKAGEDKIIKLPTNTLDISATATDDGTIAAILWEKKSGPTATLNNEFTLTLSLSDLVEGEYEFSITVTDDLDLSSQDVVRVSVLPEGTNISPVANAGGNKFITLPTNAITLNGSATDPDGSIASVLWEKTSGPAATISGENTENLDLSDLVEGNYTFQFTATDNEGASSTDIVNISVNSVNQNPFVDAGENKTLFLPINETLLEATALDVDGTIATVLWEKIAGGNAVLIGADNLILNVSGLVEDEYEFRITVTDNQGASSSDNVFVSVKVNTGNLPPDINAGSDQVIFLPTNSTTFKALGSDVDGTVTGYAWTKLSGPALTLINANTNEVIASNLLEGQYVLRVTATDNDGATSFDDVKLTVNPASANQSPTANAGENINLKLPTNTVVVNGSGSDPDGTIASYLWTKLSGPSATLTNANTSNVSLSNLVEGSYEFRLTVTDNDGATHFDDMRLTVLPADINKTPIANAGINQTLVLPTNLTNLVGVGSDEDGTVDSYLWTKVSGPTGFTLSNAGNPIATVADLEKGVYVFRLTVTDNDNASASDEVTITVVEASANQPPVANAGGDQLIKLPTSSLTLFGQGQDADGSIASYFWELETGNTVTMVDENTANLSISNLIAGVYTFKLTVTDNDGAANSDLVKVTVLTEATNLPPIANAGLDKKVFMSELVTTLKGKATDADGTITSVVWEKQIGPNITMTGNTTTSLKLSNFIEGNYVFRFTVVDDKGGSDYDEVSLTIANDSDNKIPLVDIGPDVDVYLPETTHTFSPSVSDPDGTVEVYFWEKISGGSITLTNPDEADLLVENLVEGKYVLQLNIVDNDGASNFDRVVINVLSAAANIPPVVSAGDDIEVAYPGTSADITTAIATDEDGTIASILWNKVSGGAATITGGNTITPSITGMAVGSYVFQVTVTDNAGATANDNMNITVMPEPANELPVVSAGANQNFIFPVDIITLVGTATDNDGAIESSNWFQVDGPTTTTITDIGNFSIEVTDITEVGVYTFRFSATDNEGGTASDDVVIVVFADTEDSRQPPVAYAGEDVVVVLPDNSFEIIGEGFDSDGNIEEYIWTQSGGLSIEYLAVGELLSASDVPEGAYEFTLTVTDNDTLSANDVVSVVVTESGGFITASKIFSPNGDGIKDTWEIANVESIAGCLVEIFSRSGQKVYESNDYQNDWDGTYNGNQLPQGDYYYVIRCSGKVVKNGAMRIIR